MTYSSSYGRTSIFLFILILCSSIAAPAHAAGGSVYIAAVSPLGAIDPGTPVTFSALASGFTDPVYQIADAFTPTAAIASGPGGFIDKIGFFTWTPTPGDAGRHVIMVSVSDAYTHVASSTVAIIVTSKMVVVSNLLPASGVVVTRTPITFSVVAPGFVMPNYGIYDATPMTTLSPSNITSTGLFSWTPTADDLGVHALLVHASDSQGHSAQTSVTISVTNPPASTTPIVAAVTNTTVTTAPAATTPAPSTAPAVPSATISAYHFTSYLALGTRGAAVTGLQNRLTTLGLYAGPITGYYGALTAAAVKKFQKAHGLEAVGSIGPRTRAALNSI